MEFVQNTFVNMFDGSPEKALRAVLAVMGCYVLTAAPLVAWVLHGLFQKDPKVKEQPQNKAEPQLQLTASDAALKLIRSRRSVFPKDYTGQLVSRVGIELRQEHGQVCSNLHEDSKVTACKWSLQLLRSVLEQMLEAANWAPTHGRTEPWRFVVLGADALQDMISLTDRVLKATLDEPSYAKKKAKLESKAALYPRATFIAICSLRQANPDKVQPEWEEMAATSCAVQNLWLMGSSLGVAGYWTSWQGEAVCNSKEMKDFLGIGAADSCLGFYLVGNSDRISTYRSKRGDMSDKVVWK